MTEDEKQQELEQAENLRDVVWHWQVYRKPRASWDHDHCFVCGTRIAEADYGDPEALQAAYQYIFAPEISDEIERYEWVCADCFAELKETFHWRVANHHDATIEKHSLKIQLIALALMPLILAVATLFVFAPELAHWAYLQWAAKHPALRAQYDPHHWVTRVAAVIFLYTISHAFVRALRPALLSFRAWRCVFLPWPWEKRRQPVTPRRES